jgi:hypothetical protein
VRHGILVPRDELGEFLVLRPLAQPEQTFARPVT